MKPVSSVAIIFSENWKSCTIGLSLNSVNFLYSSTNNVNEKQTKLI